MNMRPCRKRCPTWRWAARQPFKQVKQTEAAMYTARPGLRSSPSPPSSGVAAFGVGRRPWSRRRPSIRVAALRGSRPWEFLAEFSSSRVTMIRPDIDRARPTASAPTIEPKSIDRTRGEDRATMITPQSRWLAHHRRVAAGVTFQITW